MGLRFKPKHEGEQGHHKKHRNPVCLLLSIRSLSFEVLKISLAQRIRNLHMALESQVVDDSDDEGANTQSGRERAFCFCVGWNKLIGRVCEE